MEIKKLLSRLAIFFLGIPAILAIVYFSQLHSLALHILILFAIITSSLEMHNLLSSKGKIAPKAFLTILCTLPTLCSYAALWFNLDSSWIFITFVFASILACIYEIFSPRINKVAKDNERTPTQIRNEVSSGVRGIVRSNKVSQSGTFPYFDASVGVCTLRTNQNNEIDFSFSIHAIISNVFLIFYCGLLPAFISMLTRYEFSTAYICTYFVLVFGCDSFAWFFGMLFGKNNRGFIKISPNKSIAGFVGGILSTVGIAILCKFLFKVSFEQVPYWGMALLGFGSAVFAITGDLLESLIKRSANIKDSGKIIMGRGGMLDSIDSLLFVIPFFYLIIRIFIAKA